MIVYSNVPTFKEWLTKFKLLFQALIMYSNLRPWSNIQPVKYLLLTLDQEYNFQLTFDQADTLNPLQDSARH